MGHKRNAYMVLMGKPEGGRPLGRRRLRWKDTDKMNFREIGCGGVNWIHPAQDRDQYMALVNTVINLRVP
jgi:hypothetical protein